MYQERYSDSGSSTKLENPSDRRFSPECYGPCIYVQSYPQTRNEGMRREKVETSEPRISTPTRLGSRVLNQRSLGGGDFEVCGASRVFFYSISSTNTDYFVQVIV